MPSAVPVPDHVAIPVGSLVLVTGVNGYIGARVAEELLNRGYRVRGIVRRNTDWLTSLFDQRYGSGRFEIYQVSDVAEEEKLVPAMKDVSGVLHVASDVSFYPDPTVVIPTAINLATSVLSAKRVPLRPVLLDDYAEDYIAEAAEPGPYGPGRGVSTYGASKALAEKAVWEWARGHPGSAIAVNTVLPDFNVGLPLSPGDQGWPSTAGVLKALFEGDVAYGRMLPPQHAVAVQDTALLHVAALLHPDVRNERVFAFAEQKTANRILEVFARLYPQRTFAPRDPDEGEDLTNVVEKPRAEELLRWVAGRSWIPFDESVKECGDYLVAHEKSNV